MLQLAMSSEEINPGMYILSHIVQAVLIFLPDFFLLPELILGVATAALMKYLL